VTNIKAWVKPLRPPPQFGRPRVIWNMNFVRSAVLLVLIATASFAQQRDYTRWVNPFIGTGGHGHTFPGATMPFGMVQLSPDTRIDNWDGSSGYHYSDDVIFGFSHTHLSGTGIPDGCDILLIPELQGPKFYRWPGESSAEGTGSKFSHANEKAEPGFYSVRLDEGIFAELTATSRVGFHRYTFPKSALPFAFITLNLKWRDRAIDSKINDVGATRIEGYRRSSSWAKNQIVFFVAEFSRPFDASSGMTHELPAAAEETRQYKRGLRFNLGNETQVLVKVAISNVSIEGARKNLEAELPHWDFDKVRADAKAAWNKELSKIEVSGGTDEQTTNFYTALYHTMIHPNVFYDVDGKYRGHDGKTHILPGYLNRRDAQTGVGRSTNPKSKIENPKSEHYTVFSLWDTFRAAHPLYTIIDQRRTVDYINSFLRIYEQGGRLPVWELWGEETDTMIGYHAVSVIADAMAKGIQGFDYDKAYKAAKHSAELHHFGLGSYKRRGFISSEDENESVSKTLEYAYNDYCIATMAQALMLAKLKEPAKYKHLSDKVLEAEADKYFTRSLYYRNLFDAETGFMRPRRNGGWLAPFQPNEVTFHFTEGNSWQYSFFVPHDIAALAELHGGKIRFAKKLDDLFTTEQKLTGREQPDITGLIGQYAHGNEPSHHMAYLYNYANQPWKTQAYARRIMDEFYKNAPDGLIGNEDCGQMSAWYVLSALGFYQVNPSKAAYDLGTPIFGEARINLESGKTFTIKAPGVSSTNKYVKRVTLNAKPHRATFFQHRDLMAGGNLEFQMAAQPVQDWYTEFSSTEVGGKFVAAPLIEGPRVFKDKAEITLRSLTPGTKISYFVDSKELFPKTMREYTGPFTIDATSHVEAYATDPRTGLQSKKVEASFHERANDWSVTLLSSYSPQYTGGGDDAIIDGLRGTPNFASGEWQGYWGKPFEAVIDLRRETEIKTVGGSFLQSARSWIWMPDRVEFEVSTDGAVFRHVATIRPGFPQQEMNPAKLELFEDIPPVKTRYVRVRAFNFGKIPSWHPGAGGDPWIFVDEIVVR
jgi:predicted alpha-1,2-mannosidase